MEGRESLSTNRITIKIEGIEPEQLAYDTVRSVADMFEAALNLVAQKSVGYGDAWAEQGWMGNLARIMSKTSRLKNLLWQDMEFADSTESVDDTLLDLINLGAFMRMNRLSHNRWGNHR